MYRVSQRSVTFLACFLAPALVNASAFVPAGLQPGDTYQLAFVTQGSIDATSPDIRTYNDFVNNQAELNPSLTGADMGVEWFAIASTFNDGDASANARSLANNVFLLDGTQIASADMPLYGGALLSPLATDQFGALVLPTFIWTGSDSDGSSPTKEALGSTTFLSTVPLLAGDSGRQDTFWLSRRSFERSVKLPLYALSEKLTVPTPSALALGILAFCASIGSHRFWERIGLQPQLQNQRQQSMKSPV